MGILVAAGNGFDFDSIPADFLGEGGEVGGGRHDTKFAVRTARWRTDEREDESAGSQKRADPSTHFCASHGISGTFLRTGLRTDARRARPSRIRTGTEIRWRW